MEFSVFRCFFPKGVQLQLDGLRLVKVYWEPRDVWEHSVRVLPTKACWVKMNSCCLIWFLGCYITDITVITCWWRDSAQHTCEVTTVPSIALDDGGDYVACVALASVSVASLLLIQVNVHSFLDWESMHQHLLSSSGEKIPYPPCRSMQYLHWKRSNLSSFKALIVELGLHLIRFFFILWQSNPGWLEKSIEHLRFDEWYSATFGLTLLRSGCFPAIHFARRTEWWVVRLDVIGCMFR